MNILVQTAEQLRVLASQQDACLVSFSGGKDSRIVLDMARRSFKKVVGFFFYFVPNLRCDAERLKIAETWGVEILQYPDKGFINALKHGVYGFRTPAHDALPAFEQPDLYAAVRSDTGIRAIFTGMKKSDSIARKRMLTKYTAADVYHPLLNWANFDVLAYCRLHEIDLPIQDAKKRSSGTGLSLDALTFMYEHYPDDFEKLCDWFPFARAVIYRERWFWDYGKETKETAGQENAG